MLSRIDSYDSDKKTYIPAIDGIRAIAVILVLLSHWLPGFSWLYNWGAAGVYVFFFISGFVITSGLIKEKGKNGSINIASFFKRRMARIWPIYFIALAFAALFMGLEHPIYHVFFLSNILFSFTSGSHFPVHFWSLSVEQQFYLLWPLVFMLLGVRNRMVVCLAFCLIGILSRWAFLSAGNAPAAIYMPTSNFDAIAYGALLAIIKSEIRFDISKSIRINVLLLSIFTMSTLMCLSHEYGRMAINTLAPVPIAGITFFAISSCWVNGVTSRILSFPPLVFVGKVSYGVYLYHLFIGYLLWPHMSDMNIAFFITTAFLVTLIISTISWYLIEKPIIGLARNGLKGISFLKRPAV
jgi:peptidoglycan/LPS O-acetylase OafA/YrhL